MVSILVETTANYTKFWNGPVLTSRQWGESKTGIDFKSDDTGGVDAEAEAVLGGRGPPPDGAFPD